MTSPLHRYTTVACPFCAVRPGTMCIITRGDRAGEFTEHPHVVRSYAYFAAERARQAAAR